MKRPETKRMRGRAVCCGCAWLLGMAASLGAEQPAAEEPSLEVVRLVHERAAIAVELTYSPDVLPLVEDRLSDLWNSPAVRRQALESALEAGENHPWVDDRVRIDVTPLISTVAVTLPAEGLARTVSLSVGVRRLGGPGAGGLLSGKTADELRTFLERATARIAELLRQAHHRNVDNLSERLRQADRALAEAFARREEAMARQSELVQRGGWGSLDRSMLGQTLHGLRRQQQEIGIEAAALEARREAIGKEIARVGKEAARVQDPLLAQLEEVLALRKKSLDTVRRMLEAGRVPEIEAAQAQEAYLLAEIELEKHRSGLSAEGGVSEQLAGLNAQLSEATIRTGELEVRSRMLQEAAARLEGLFALVDEYEQRELDVRLAAVAAEEAGRLRDELADRLHSAVEPRLQIVDMSAAEAPPPDDATPLLPGPK